MPVMIVVQKVSVSHKLACKLQLVSYRPLSSQEIWWSLCHWSRISLKLLFYARLSFTAE